MDGLCSRAAGRSGAGRGWRRLGRLLVLGALPWLATACGTPPDESLDAAEAALARGDPAASQALFREALERHPDHVDLLVFAAGFYLDPGRPDDYKPRLSIHYAHRAHRAAGGERADAAAALVRALGAMDQREEARRVLDEALALHPDDPELRALQVERPAADPDGAP